MTKNTTIAANEGKWGKDIWGYGWTGVPIILLEKQHTLGLSAMDFNVLIQLLKHWWTKDNLARPSKKSVAELIGVSPATVQRSIRNMESLGYIKRIEIMDQSGQRPNEYDFQPLIKILTPKAKEMIELKKTQEKDRQAKRRKR